MLGDYGQRAGGAAAEARHPGWATTPAAWLTRWRETRAHPMLMTLSVVMWVGVVAFLVIWFTRP